MMIRRRLFRTMIILLLVFAFFGIVSRTAYNAGWTQGYVIGSQTGEDGNTAVPHMPFGPGYWGPGRAIFGGLSFLAFGLFSFMMLGFLGKMFFFKKHRHGPWKNKHWQNKWRGHHGPRPPWFDTDNDTDEPIMKA